MPHVPSLPPPPFPGSDRSAAETRSPNSRGDRAGQGARSRFRRATHDLHGRLNRHPLLAGLTRPELSRDAYGRILGAYARFYRRLEGHIGTSVSRLEGAFAYGARVKAGWLDQDLAFLGRQPTGARHLAEADWDPGPIGSLGELAGVLYAVEGSTLGGQVIARHLEKHLGLTPQGGARFFAGYGEQTATYWQAFLDWLEQLDLDPGQWDRGEAAARRVFTGLEALLDAQLAEPDPG